MVEVEDEAPPPRDPGPQSWQILYRDVWPSKYGTLFRERDRTEQEHFKDIFGSFASLYTQLEQYRAKITMLDYERLKRQEDINNVINNPSNTLSENDLRYLGLQEEIIQLQTSKDSMQQDLYKMAAKAKDVAKKEIQIMELERRVQLLVEENETLKDEHTTMSLILKKADEEKKRMAMENGNILEKLLQQKKDEADVVNMHNETMKKLKEHQIFYELESARREDSISPEQSASSRCRLYSGPSIIPKEVQNKVESHTSELYSVAFSYQGTTMATCGADKCIKMWRTTNLPSLDNTNTLLGCNAGVMSVDIDERDHYLVAGSNDAAVRLWQVNSSAVKSQFMGHDNKVYTVKFYNHSQRIVSGSHDRTLRLWDVRSSKNIRTIFARSSCHDLAVLSEQGTNIVSCHFDKRLRFWDERQDTSSHEMLLDGRITSVDLSMCGKFLACSCKDSSVIKLIDLKLNQAIATFTHDGLRIGEHTRCAFSPDGQYIACGSGDGSIFIWNTRTLKREEVPKVHNNAVVAVKWHPLGQSFVSVEKSKKFFVWTGF